MEFLTTKEVNEIVKDACLVEYAMLTGTDLKLCEAPVYFTPCTINVHYIGFGLWMQIVRAEDIEKVAYTIDGIAEIINAEYATYLESCN